MEYVRQVDFAAIAKSGVNERLTRICSITPRVPRPARSCIKDARWRRLPGRYARHAVDQIFYT